MQRAGILTARWEMPTSSSAASGCAAASAVSASCSRRQHRAVILSTQDLKTAHSPGRQATLNNIKGRQHNPQEFAHLLP